MKELGLVIFLLGFSLAVLAQSEQEMPEPRLFVPEIPELEYDFSDSIPYYSFPEVDEQNKYNSHRNFTFSKKRPPGSGFELLARHPMPVVIPESGFHSDMPVVVPDSSFHYHILQKKIDLQRFPPVQNR